MELVLFFCALCYCSGGFSITCSGPASFMHHLTILLEQMSLLLDNIAMCFVSSFFFPCLGSFAYTVTVNVIAQSSCWIRTYILWPYVWVNSGFSNFNGFINISDDNLKIDY